MTTPPHDIPRAPGSAPQTSAWQTTTPTEYTTPWAPPPSPPPRRGPRGLLIAAAAVAAVLLLGAGGAIALTLANNDSPSTTSAAQTSAAPGASATTAWSPPANVYATPVPGDFTLTVVELSRKCFGSAGCNVTFSIQLANVSGNTFDPAKSYKIVYAINEAEDTYSNNLTITGTQYSYRSEEFVQVKNKSTKLTATITAIVPV